jgi:4,5:9,10-diseco-3-hydroxy-5,9,17-trioxoandrosta-1(10),2-diene-4-oate hydrolase
MNRHQIVKILSLRSGATRAREGKTMTSALRVAVGADGVTGKQIEVDGIRLAYDDEGSGPPLVCLHSIAHGARDFAALRARLRSRHRVVALDWPGHGRSADDHAPASAARYAELLAGFVAALGLRDVVLIGNSIGGSAALRYAASRPGFVRALVLVDSAGLDQVDRLIRAVTRAMAAFFAAGARGARWFPRAFDLYYRLLLTEQPARAQRARIVAAAVELAPRLVEAWRSFGEPSADVRALAADLACPVLVAWARHDRVLQLRRSMPCIATIPNRRVELFAGGHAPFLECPDAFCRALESFLEGIEAAPAVESSAELDDARECRRIERHHAQPRLPHQRDVAQ